MCKISINHREYGDDNSTLKTPESASTVFGMRISLALMTVAVDPLPPDTR